MTTIDISSLTHGLAMALRVRRANPFTGLRGVAATLLAALTIPSAFADWNREQVTLGTHPTWIYTPTSTMASGKRGLMVVLHGCAQTNTELKNHGNLSPAADASGLVLALPYVGKNDQWGPGCWDYDRATDSHQHIAEITTLTQTLIKRQDLNIDPKQVYVVGLSSGAALSLLLGCSAPDVYAGIAAIAGPSVGSSQQQATTPALGIPDSNIADAAAKCRSLAGAKSPSFATQVANIAYGKMDKDGPDARYDACLLSPPLSDWFCSKHPGQYRVVSVKWSQDNAEMLKSIYGTDNLDGGVNIQDGMATEQAAKNNGSVRVGLVAMEKVGHAWPAGSGSANGQGGDWVAQSGLNYPKYVTEWLIHNNRRASGTQ